MASVTVKVSFCHAFCTSNTEDASKITQKTAQALRAHVAHQGSMVL